MMKKNYPWQFQDPIDAIIFDCDGTLSQLEGIDALAEQNGVGEKVCALTAKAMSETGITPDLYAKRLSLVQPTLTQVKQLGEQYFESITPNVREVFEALRAANKKIYVFSAGVNPAVRIFAGKLGLLAEEVFAVDLRFDHQGQYLDYDHASPFASNAGKRDAIMHLHARHERMVLIGDGMNDYNAHDQVTRFIGFGGAFYRESIARLAECYITENSILSLLPLVLTEQEQASLPTNLQAYYQQGLQAILQAKVLFNKIKD